MFPDRRLLHPSAYLAMLTVVLGVMSYLRGGAALFVVSIPHFWLFTRSPRSAIAHSGVAAAATVLGGIAALGWQPDINDGNFVITVVGYAASVALGLFVHRLLERGEERARLLSAELEAARRSLAEAHQRQGATEERERLAREIHDTLAQGFASIIVLAEAARAGLDTHPATSAQQLLSIERTARENFAEARVLVGSAPQSGLSQGSIAQTLRRTAERFGENTGITVSTELDDVDGDQTTRIALLRCTQESLANVGKHANASTVGIVLTRGEDVIELEITDDGRGFAVDTAEGFGLVGMRRRLAELGGELTVTSSPGNGTRVLAALPVNSQG
ncbi:sensor histidine kinase [Micromonospora sp. NPDC047670]|uniref:sensor histidine kinase n=1 Tax=Micromonospora sp. NPDC047670 TaxID=3364252 RepID=UPI00371DE52D